MAASSRPAIPRDWRLVAAIGGACFAASFAALPLSRAGRRLDRFGARTGVGLRRGADRAGGDGGRDPDPRAGPAGAQPAHARRARQHEPRPVHVRRPSAAGRLQPPLRRHVPAAGRDRAPRHHAAARCSNTAPRTAASRARSTTIWSSSRPRWRAAQTRSTEVKSADGRNILVTNRPMRAAAGWRRTRTSPSGATPSASAPPCKSSSSAAP